MVRMALSIPVNSCPGNSEGDFIDILETTSIEGQGTQLFPPGLDKIEPRPVRWLEKKAHPRMGQGPKPCFQRAVDRKVIQNQNQVSRGPYLAYILQKSGEVGTATSRRTGSVGQTRSGFKGAEGPETLTSSVVRRKVRSISRLGPTSRRIGLGADRSHLVDAQHMRLRRWGYVTLDDGPLFSANCGSGRSVKYVFSWYQRRPSSSNTRASCAREIPMPSSSLRYLTR